MNIGETSTDAAVLRELGARLKQQRLESGMTQAKLAKEAGVSKSTVERMESGHSGQLTNLLRILRSLGLLQNVDVLLPSPVPGPMQLLRNKVAHRQRARSKSAEPDSDWSWGDDT